jgi:hypothetical protein
VLSREPYQRHDITSAAVAQGMAERQLKRLVSVRNVYTFTLGWQFILLEPMDVVSLPGEAICAALEGHDDRGPPDAGRGRQGRGPHDRGRGLPARPGGGDDSGRAEQSADQLDPPTDGVIVGMNGCDQSSSANPQYFSLTGELLSADRISGVAVASGIPAQANHAFPPGVDIVITGISVHAWYFFPLAAASVGTMRFVFNDIVQREPTDMVMYWNADRTSDDGRHQRSGSGHRT